MVVDRHQTDLYVRPSWLDAAIALRQIEKGNAEGSRSALWFRCRLQKHLFELGCFLQRHAGKVLFVAILVLATFCVGLKSVIIHSKVDQLWTEEGGRLERELKSVESALGESTSYTHQLVIQTPKDPSSSLLLPDALLTHLKVLQAATTVSVDLFDIIWKFKDVCYTPNFNKFDGRLIDDILPHIIPCTIITPLDCFWEGSKLLGPDPPIKVPSFPEKIKWTSLNPKEALMSVSEHPNANVRHQLRTLERIMERAGITTGYQEKPCLNPQDPDCPSTAPYKNASVSRYDIIIREHLTRGCSGFASNYMRWPKGLVIGGITKGANSVIENVKALQSVLQLMSEQELYEFYVNDYKVHHISWTPQKAGMVLEAWQKKFSQEIRNQINVHRYNIYSFSTATLNDVLSHFSNVNFKEIFIGYLLMLCYVMIYLFSWKDPILSQTSVGIAGTLLLMFSVAAALGVCAVFGIAFNASTTQIVPYLGLGLGVIEMFLLTRAYVNELPAEGRLQKQTGNVLKRGGINVLLSSLSIMFGLAIATIIPIPAVRVFCMQAAIIVLFNLVTLLLVFPAIISLDLRRRRSGRVDLFCCCCVMPDNSNGGGGQCIENSPLPVNRKFPTGEKKQSITCALPPDRQQTITVLVAPPPIATPLPTNKRENFRTLRSSRLLSQDVEKCDCDIDNRRSGDKKRHDVVGGLAGEDDEEEEQEQQYEETDRLIWSLDYLMEYYVRWLNKRMVKVSTVLLFIGLLIASVWHITKIVYGLDLSDLAPQNTDEHAFLSAQENYFGFYNMYAVTQGNFDYAANQQLLYDYHKEFANIPDVYKNDDGKLPEFWLELMRNWLKGLQEAFVKDWDNGAITQECWFANATEEGILAYRLLVQTGNVSNPVDRTVVDRNRRLVDENGRINKEGFYNYLTVWTSNDVLAYGASQANLKPVPKSWIHVPNDFELKIPKSSALTYAQMPFYLHSLNSSTRITDLISSVRDICKRFEDKGLPNFPTGIPFQFWEQYQTLPKYLILAVSLALASVFFIVWLLLLNIRAASVVALQLTSMLLQLFGSFAIIDVKLNAVSAVMLVISVGFNTHFIVHTCYSFLTAIGSRQRRLELSIKQVLPILLHVVLATLLSTGMLAINEFDFIVRYFFHILTTMIGIGLLNALLIFPVMLLLIGPPSEVKPTKYPDRIGTPSPEPAKKPSRNHSYRQAKIPQFRRHREPSLSTITEEPGSWYSTAHEIVMEPELIVETTTCTHPHSSSSPSDSHHHSNNENESSCSSSPTSVHRSTIPSSVNSSSASSSMPLTSTHVTTKVTATAKFKVELHTPIHTTYERSYNSGGGGGSRRSNGRRRGDSSGGSSSLSAVSSSSSSTTTTTTSECPSKHCSGGGR